MTKMHPIEGDVKTAIKKLLDKHGWFHFMPPANKYGKSGISDILAVKAGRFLALEVKLKKAEGTANQEEFLKSVREHGGYGMVINMATLPVLERWLQDVDDLGFVA